jgi:ferredoxin-NADP reductase
MAGERMREAREQMDGVLREGTVDNPPEGIDRGDGRTIDVRVKSVTYQAEGINSYELIRLDRELPAFSAGSHIDVHIAPGVTRTYSLLNAPSDRRRYVIAVLNDPAGRGGSRLLHQAFRAGDAIKIGAPRNNFPLADAAHSVLIAGGIGITPLWSMVQDLEEHGRSWELHYCSRTPAKAALLPEVIALEAARPGRVHLIFDGEPGAAALDIARLVSAQAPDAHLYCCGPSGMLAAFRAATAKVSPARVHFEYFSAGEPTQPTAALTVVLARSGRTVAVPAGKTILAALLEHSIQVEYACEQGICGTCKVRVLQGVPDHRDLILSEADKASGETMLICCSSSKTPTLVLDI